MPHVVYLGEAALVPQFLLKMSPAELHGKQVITLSKQGWAVPAIPQHACQVTFVQGFSKLLTHGSAISYWPKTNSRRLYKSNLTLSSALSVLFYQYLTSSFTKCGPCCSGSGGGGISASSWVIHALDGLSVQILRRVCTVKRTCGISLEIMEQRTTLIQRSYRDWGQSSVGRVLALEGRKPWPVLRTE